MSENSRKRIVVHPDVQFALLKRMLLQWFLFICIVAFVASVVYSLSSPFESAATLDKQFQVLFVSLLVAAVCLVPLFIFDSLRLSNRFVGPVVRLKSYVKSVDSPDVEPLSFRKNDFFNEVAGEVNEMMARLRAAREKESAPSTAADSPSIKLAKTDL